MAKLRIALNGRFLTQAVTGVQRVAIELCVAFDKHLAEPEFADIEIELIAPRSAKTVTELNFENIKIRRRGWLRGHLWEQLSLPWLARGRILLSLGNTAPLAQLLFRPHRTHVLIHDLSYRYFPTAYSRTFRLFYSLLMPIILRRARTVFTVSDSERDAIEREFPALTHSDRIVVAQNGAGFPSQDGPRVERHPRGRVCLYVGSLTARKNAEGLLQAAIALVRDHDVTFRIVGSSAASFENVDTAIPADVAGRISFAGQIDDPELLASEYRSAAVFVFPSFYEASPLPPVEAMWFGCPVVASDIPSLRERCGPAARYCDPADVGSIVRSTVELLDSQELWEAARDCGDRQWRGFSWAQQAATLLERVRQAV